MPWSLVGEAEAVKTRDHASLAIHLATVKPECGLIHMRLQALARAVMDAVKPDLFDAV
jgi:hypothetical protein